MKKVKSCGACRFVKVPSKQTPCSHCSVDASGYVTSLWQGVKKQKSLLDEINNFNVRLDKLESP